MILTTNFSATAIDPVTGMAIFFGGTALIHFILMIVLSAVTRLFVPTKIRSHVQGWVFSINFVVGAVYLWPIAAQPIYQNPFVRDKFRMACLGDCFIGDSH